MTITEIYVVYGWAIPKKKYREYCGYTVETFMELPVEVQEAYSWNNESEKEDKLQGWFIDYELYGGCSDQTIIFNSHEFVLREFPHNIDMDYYVMGISISTNSFNKNITPNYAPYTSTISSLEIQMTTYCLTKQGIPLEIINIIISYLETNIYDKELQLLKNEYGDLLEGNPSIFTIPNDCSCCS